MGSFAPELPGAFSLRHYTLIFVVSSGNQLRPCATVCALEMVIVSDEPRVLGSMILDGAFDRAERREESERASLRELREGRAVGVS